MNSKILSLNNSTDKLIVKSNDCIETGVLLIIAAFIVATNRKMFFDKPLPVPYE